MQPITSITIDGKAIAGQTLTPDVAGKRIVCIGGEPGTGKRIWVYGPTRQTLDQAYVADGKMPLDLPAGDYTIKARDAIAPTPTPDAFSFKIKAASPVAQSAAPVAVKPAVEAPKPQAPLPTAATPPAIVVKPAATPAKPAAEGAKPAVVTALKFPVIGACVTLDVVGHDDDAATKYVTQAKPLGITIFRSFGASCVAGGTVDPGYGNQVRRLTSRGMKVMLMHGIVEGSTTIPADDDWKKHFDAVAVIRNNDANYIPSHQNEFNAKHYWPLGRDAAFNADAVTRMLAIIKIARTSLGKDCTIVGPSIGYNDNTKPHLEYQKALLDGGMLDYVNAIDTHCYFDTPAEAEAVFGQYREWVGPNVTIYSTETNVPGTDAKTYAAKAAPVLAVLHKHNVVPIHYRLMPRDATAEVFGPSLFGLDGTLRTPVAQALDMA